MPAREKGKAANEGLSYIHMCSVHDDDDDDDDDDDSV